MSTDTITPEQIRSDTPAERLLFAWETAINREERLEKQLELYKDEPDSIPYRLTKITLSDVRERIDVLKAQIHTFIKTQDKETGRDY